jgi:hypothetical protein
MGIQSWNIESIESGEQSGGISPHALTHHAGGADALSAEAIGARPAGINIDWGELGGIPSEFWPEPHFHLWGEVLGWPDLFPPAAHASSHSPGASDPITPALIGAEPSGAAAAAISSLLSRGNNEIFKRLSIAYSEPPQNIIPANSTQDVIISNPSLHQGGCLIIVGGYGNSVSGIYSGLYFLSGLLFYPYPSQEGSILKIHRIVEEATGGTLTLTALIDGTLRLRLVNSSLSQPKLFRFAQILI